MKRNFSCSGSVNHFLSHPIEGEMKSEEDSIYNGVGNGDGDDYETGHVGDKKRRLSNHQVKSLEKIFEVDNKLDPDRKVKVAHDLGLQPRQVAIWFQNRRARWKTKQLETDYNLLKSNYDTLTHNYRKLEQDKEIILKELVELKAKLHEKTEIKDEYEDRQKYSFFLGSDPTHELNYEKTEKLLELKDGFSDSDSSGVLNEENLNISNTNITTFGVSSLCSSSPTTSNHTELKDHGAAYQESSDTYLVNNVEDESCNIFLVDQAPNLCWYFRDYMN